MADRSAAVDTGVAPLQERTAAELGEVIARLEAPLESSREPGSTPAGNWMGDVMREATTRRLIRHPAWRVTTFTRPMNAKSP